MIMSGDDGDHCLFFSFVFPLFCFCSPVNVWSSKPNLRGKEERKECEKFERNEEEISMSNQGEIMTGN